MWAYQCSRCRCLEDRDEYVMCTAHIDPRPNHRAKGDAKLCRKSFEPLKDDEVWHEKFSWED
mgnify:FL=1